MRAAITAAAALLAAPASAQLTQAQLDTVSAKPPAGARLPGALVVADPAGRHETLADVAGGRPMLLMFADYTCRHVCGPGLALTAGALADAGLVPGRDVTLATLGLDPRDTPADAARMADAQLAAQPGARRAIRLLSASPASVAAAERALGYRAVYDAGHDQFAHEAVVYVFAADGRLTALLPELALRPAALRAALAASAGSSPQGWTATVAHLCYGLAAAHGRFGRPIVLALQGLALAGLAAAGWLALRRRKVPA